MKKKQQLKKVEQENNSSQPTTAIASQKKFVNKDLENDLLEYKAKMINHIENRILHSQKKLEDSIREEMEHFEQQISKIINELRDDRFDHKVSSIQHQERQMEKVFRYKPSLLSEMLKQSDYKTLYHMMMASMFILMGNLWIQDYLERGIIFDMETFFWCFQTPVLVAELWFALVLSSYLTVYWVNYCYQNKIKSFTAILVFSLHQIISILAACYMTSAWVNGFGSRMIVMCEAVRMMMKNYSYARNKMLYGTENKYKYYILQQFEKKGITKQNALLPDINIQSLSQELKRYTYFFLAPTLLYRDYYVKAPNYSKKKVIIEFANFFLCIYYGFILFRSFCKEPILQLRENLTLMNFIVTLFKLMMPSTFSLVLVFFGLLHSWFNGWAELLRFPDRTFYHDWWTASEFGQYYRKWNVVVHEFLYYYVYLDSEKLSQGKRSRLFRQLITFGCSAVIHEIILTFALGFFYPICFLLFTGPGILFIQAKEVFKSGWFNILFWVLMYIGTSVMITLYLTEYYARILINDQLIEQRWGIIQYVIPRTFYLITGI
ncbi:unnamed protein product [Paramecium primaurelia]|uniref:O-acyltransferase n=1 Tax=Paramecium primaurelia TaxID=5886 RepID=A0A8S1MZ36_PARPR|nr:unnamed protein product [Paramecium primaurelia]